MNFKKFFEVNPSEIEKAKACANFEEFKKLVDKNGITYKDEEEVKSAFDFIKGKEGELSDDLLEAASGGRAKNSYVEIDENNLYKNKNGKYIYKK